MNNSFCIYVFSDQHGLPRYVGKAKNFDKRMKDHLYRDRFKYPHTWFYRWLNKQIREDKEFFIDILEEVNQDNWIERERYWIAHIKENRYRLTNMTDGGDGNNNQVFSKETLIKRSKSLMGHPVSEETRRKISNGHKGKIVKEETRQKLSKFFTGKKCSEELKEHLSKKVSQFDLNNNFVREFKSLTSASEYLKCRKSILANAISRNKNGKFKNYLWKYS